MRAAYKSHVETKIYSGAFCLRQNAQRAALCAQQAARQRLACPDQGPSRMRRARPQSGFAAARAACVSTWLGAQPGNEFRKNSRSRRASQHLHQSSIFKCNVKCKAGGARNTNSNMVAICTPLHERNDTQCNANCHFILSHVVTKIWGVLPSKCVSIERAGQ